MEHVSLNEETALVFMRTLWTTKHWYREQEGWCLICDAWRKIILFKHGGCKKRTL